MKLFMQMNTYKLPIFLEKRYPLFEQRWDLREQFSDIINLMELNKDILNRLLSQNHHKKEEIQILLNEMEEFRIWSWKEADRDEMFYNKIIEFDKKTFRFQNNLV